MSVTVKDVIALARVSPSAISQTCRDHLSISRQTKEKVWQAMVKLGYKPNFQASNLATQDSRTVGIILPPSEWEAYQNPFCLETTRGISQYCNQEQYIDTVVMGRNGDEVLQAIKTMVRTDLAEGFIVLYSRRQGPVLDHFYEEGLLCVLIGKVCRSVDQAVYVGNNNMFAGREAAEHLLNLGHVRIAYLPGGHFPLYNHDRKMEYMLALTEKGVPSDSQLCVGVPSVPEEQDQAPEALPTRGDRPTTALVSDDILAVALEKTCTGLRLSVPGDVSILSFNNSLLSRPTLSPLTFVDVNAYQLGVEIAIQVINHAENPELVATKIIAPHRLMERESCAGTGRLCGDWDAETA